MGDWTSGDAPGLEENCGTLAKNAVQPQRKVWGLRQRTGN